MANESARQRVKLFVVCAMAGLSGLLFGYDTGVISGAILFIKQEYTLTTGIEELIVAMVALGAVFGSITGGPSSDKFGRKKVVLFSAAMFVVSALGLALAPSPIAMIVWRFFVGFAIGVSSATTPLYISELAPYNLRGSLVTLLQLFITIGILLAYLAGLAFASFSGWRWMFALASIPAALQFFVMLFFPESPRWLAMTGHQRKATEILERYRGTRNDAELEIDYIIKRVAETQPTWRELFNRRFRPALLAGVGVTIIQQLVGINTVIYYAPTIFKLAGFASDKAAIVATTWVGIVNVLATFIALFFFDRLGRKPLLLIGLGGMIVALGVLGFGFLPIIQTADFDTMGYISIASIIFYIACFAFSLGPGAWLINSEIYPAKIRGKAMGLSTCANWVFNFIVTSTFLNLINFVGKSGAFWTYGIIGVLGIFFVTQFVPETNNKTLEEIEGYWKGNNY
ncbi:MAG: sugar porter family MFS transporter [Simkaniaceae bacterium]|nr:sugar porter family MFS transporter [Simkaniaceae bacterium]